MSITLPVFHADEEGLFLTLWAGRSTASRRTPSWPTRWPRTSFGSSPTTAAAPSHASPILNIALPRQETRRDSASFVTRHPARSGSTWGPASIPASSASPRRPPSTRMTSTSPKSSPPGGNCCQIARTPTPLRGPDRAGLVDGPPSPA